MGVVEVRRGKAILRMSSRLAIRPQNWKADGIWGVESLGRQRFELGAGAGAGSSTLTAAHLY
nr:hypothetical protein Iba_chr14cCG15040 [Ipomoea batatas]GME06245.1 hypothetical protein Iba_scaffold3961.4CG1480 [Ipomoea batatas]